MEGLIFGILWGLYMEGLIFGILRYFSLAETFELFWSSFVEEKKKEEKNFTRH